MRVKMTVIEMRCVNPILIKYYYEFDDQGVFLKMSNLSIHEIKDLAVYLWFTAKLKDESIVLENMVIAQFLEKFGAKILERIPENYYEIDMFIEYERRYGDWYHQNYDKYNEKYGAQAKAFLQEKNII